MITKIKNIVEKIKKLFRRKGDKSLKIFIAFFVIGYIFFFTSNYIFPHIYRNIEVARIGDIKNLEEYVLTLNSWDYIKEEDAFEIIFEVDNHTLVDDVKYKFTLRDKEEIYNTKIHKIIDKELIIVRAYDISSRWKEVTLDIEIGKRIGNINMNDKRVTKVNNLKDRSDKEYKAYAIKSKIKGMEINIDDLTKESKEIEKKMLYAYNKLDDLEKKKEMQTENEKKTTDLGKSKLASELEHLKADIDEIMLQIEEYKQKIEIQKEKLSKLED